VTLSLRAIACGGFFYGGEKTNAEEKTRRARIQKRNPERKSERQKAKMEAGTALPL
jgi:hypothetical protein